MSLSIHTIQSKQKKKTRKRIGRGDGSDMGTYCGRGLKGQKSRSGVSGLKKLGMKILIKQTPKKRGFKSIKEKSQVIALSNLNNFKDGDQIDPKVLYDNGLIQDIGKNVKILNNGDLQVKNLKINNIFASQGAREKIEKQGGKIS